MIADSILFENVFLMAYLRVPVGEYIFLLGFESQPSLLLGLVVGLGLVPAFALVPSLALVAALGLGPGLLLQRHAAAGPDGARILMQQLQTFPTSCFMVNAASIIMVFGPRGTKCNFYYIELSTCHWLLEAVRFTRKLPNCRKVCEILFASSIGSN